MKKTSCTRQKTIDRIRYLRWQHGLRRQRRIKKRGVTNRRSAVRTTEIRIIPPRVFSFTKNYDATVSCLREIKSAALKQGDSGRGQPVFIDLEPIQEISVAGALVLAAEIDRWRRVISKQLRPRRLRHWHPKVRALLASLGFFDLLEVTTTPDEDDISQSEVTVLPMVSSTRLDQRLLKSLAAVSEVLHNDPTVYDGLVEAAYNATKHAYPSDHEWDYKPTTEGWWATASWNPASGSVKFLVYDQGVGIAATLPRWEGWEKVRQLLSGVPGGSMLKDASRMIEAALEVDRTSLAGGHGKGLQDVV